MPALERLSGLPEPGHRLDGIEQISVVAFRAAEVLSPQLQPQVARKLPRAIAKTGRIEGRPSIALVVKDGTGDLGVVAP
jgi:hypothetical protein